MKKFLAACSALFALVFVAPTNPTISAQAETVELSCKSAYLMDYDSGTVLYEKNALDHLPIASMCKIMTLLLCLESIDAGNYTVTDTVSVSERAASMGGSQVYLETGGNYEIGELLKSIVVCSANDSCVAMAETTAGSESIFVDRMNERAKELGMNDTLFANCTGLPKEPQYSCAHDVALMLRSLLSHPLYFEYSKIRTEAFRHPKDRVTEMTNTNKLIRSYEGCDSGKTGFTNHAGFCLAASAKRGNLRVISVSIGSSTSNDRFDCHRTLLDYAFANYTNRVVADAEATFEERAPVSGGKSDSTAVRVERNVCVFGKKNETADVSFEVRFDRVKAPVACGDKVGTLIVYKDNIEYDSVALVAMEDVARSTIWDEYKKNASEWGL